MSAAATITRTWVVGSRTVTLAVPPLAQGGLMHAVAEWAPDQPKRLNQAEAEQYRVGRNRAIAEIAAELGITVAVVEL